MIEYVNWHIIYKTNIVSIRDHFHHTKQSTIIDQQAALIDVGFYRQWKVKIVLSIIASSLLLYS